MPTLSMMQSKPVANDNLAFGDVVLVKFPFTNLINAKQRPAVVISGLDYNSARRDVVILAITSQMASTSDFAHGVITDWKAAGLLKPSLMKPVLATIEQSLVIRKLAHLTRQDRFKLDEILALICGERAIEGD
jgi:mRNA interferase MazF